MDGSEGGGEVVGAGFNSVSCGNVTERMTSKQNL